MLLLIKDHIILITIIQMSIKPLKFIQLEWISNSGRGSATENIIVQVLQNITKGNAFKDTI